MGSSPMPNQMISSGIRPTTGTVRSICSGASMMSSPTLNSPDISAATRAAVSPMSNPSPTRSRGGQDRLLQLTGLDQLAGLGDDVLRRGQGVLGQPPDAARDVPQQQQHQRADRLDQRPGYLPATARRPGFLDAANRRRRHRSMAGDRAVRRRPADAAAAGPVPCTGSAVLGSGRFGTAWCRGHRRAASAGNVLALDLGQIRVECVGPVVADVEAGLENAGLDEGVENVLLGGDRLRRGGNELAGALRLTVDEGLQCLLDRLLGLLGDDRGPGVRIAPAPS